MFLNNLRIYQTATCGIQSPINRGVLIPRKSVDTRFPQKNPKKSGFTF
jgi:hypothetical protein